MKGLMVPLLILMMTGMVIGQQQDSSNQFRGSADTPSNETSSRTSSNFAPIGSQADNRKLAPFELSVSDNDLLGIRKNGSVLRAKIEPRDPSTGQPVPLEVISGISLVHNDNVNRDVQVQALQGENAGNGIIRFGLDDFDLMKLQNNIKLGFEFDAASRGNFQLVEFYYKSANSNSPSGPTPDDNTSPRTTFGPQNTQSQFGQANQQSRPPLLPPPGPEALPGGSEFEGPVMPNRNDNFGQATVQNQQPSAWQPDPRSQTNPSFSNQNQFSTNNQQAPAGWNIPNRNEPKNQFNGGQNDDYQSSRDNLIALQRRLEQERIEKLEREKIAQQNTSPLSYDQQVAARWAELDRQNKNKQYESYLAEKQRLLDEKEAKIDQQRRDLDYQRYVDGLRTSRPQDVAPQITRPTGVVAGTDFRTNVPNIAPDRYASTNSNLPGTGYGPSNNQVNNVIPNRGVRDLAMSVPGVNNSRGINGNPGSLIGNGLQNGGDSKAIQDKRTEGFVYFMLLCSLGLNVYLGWISRGFYVRYHELADELRETFTATM